MADPALIPEPGEGRYSFAAFNRDFLTNREGPSMLALKSADAAADLADFEANDLPTYAPVSFQRLARTPKGDDLEVGFSVTFTSDARIPDAGFFTCQHHNPDRFWWPEYRRHANGASRSTRWSWSRRDPADYHIFFTHFTGQHDMRSDSLMVSFDTGGGKVETRHPGGGEGDGTASRSGRIRSRISSPFGSRRRTSPRPPCGSRGTAIPFVERMGRLVVPPSEACGVALAFVEG